MNLATRRGAALLEDRWGDQMLEICLIDTGNGKGTRCLLVPREVRRHLEQEDMEYWQGGDFSLLKMLYPDWYDYIQKEMGLQG